MTLSAMRLLILINKVVIKITNDTTTLNGALMELGSLMAQNLTTQGLIGVSASDGLTTLANDILLIQGGGGSDVPTILFQDSCSTDNTSDYINTIHIGSTSTTINLAFDSSSNGYLFTGTGGDYFGGKVIPITFQDKITISCDVKLLGTSAYNQCFIGLANSLNPSSSGNFDFFRIRGDNRCDYVHNNNDSSIKTGLSLVNNWVTLEISIDGTSLTGKLYDENKTLLAQTLQITNTYSNPYIFIGLNCNGNNQKYVKNIKVETIGGGGSDCSQYTTQINNAIEYINGSGS